MASERGAAVLWDVTVFLLSTSLCYRQLSIRASLSFICVRVSFVCLSRPLCASAAEAEAFRAALYSADRSFLIATRRNIKVLLHSAEKRMRRQLQGGSAGELRIVRDSRANDVVVLKVRLAMLTAAIQLSDARQQARADVDRLGELRAQRVKLEANVLSKKSDEAAARSAGVAQQDIANACFAFDNAFRNARSALSANIEAMPQLHRDLRAALAAWDAARDALCGATAVLGDALKAQASTSHARNALRAQRALLPPSPEMAAAAAAAAAPVSKPVVRSRPSRSPVYDVASQKRPRRLHSRRKQARACVCVCASTCALSKRARA